MKTNLMLRVLTVFCGMYFSGMAHADQCVYNIHTSEDAACCQTGELDRKAIIPSDGSRLEKCSECLVRLSFIPVQQRAGDVSWASGKFSYRMTPNTAKDHKISVTVNDGSEYGIMCQAEFGKKFLIPANQK